MWHNSKISVPDMLPPDGVKVSHARKTATGATKNRRAARFNTPKHCFEGVCCLRG